MKRNFQKMMREQVQGDLNELNQVLTKPWPKSGWIHLICQALGITNRQLAKRMNCSQSNIIALQRREKEGTISLQKLEQVAQAMNCRLAYFFIPNKPLDQLLEDQARLMAKKHLRSVSHSMELEDQGLSFQQKRQQEDDLVQELLQGNLKHLWEDKDEI